MAHIVTVLNFKGGVGKSTISVELSTALAKHHGRRALLIDLDPQASATFYVMEQERWRSWKEKRGTTYDLFAHKDLSFPICNAIVHDVLQEKASVIGFDLLPSSPDLVDVDLSLTDFVGYDILQNYLERVRDDYEYIICDCPPNFNPVTRNSLWTSDAYIVPTVPDFLSTYGIGLLRRSIHKMFQNNEQAFTGPVLGGIILTRIKAGTVTHATFAQQVRTDYTGHVFKHTIADSIAVANAADTHIPISAIPAPRGREAELQEQFKSLAGEFISRVRHMSLAKKYRT